MTPSPATPRILVIADDLTGAAELAGILHDAGLPTRILRTGISNALTAQGIPPRLADNSLVLDTDSRHIPPAAAADKIRFALRGLPLDAFTLIYKKTDSLLRGNVAAEIAAVQSLTGLRRTLLLPQNPSKGRIVREGRYFIDDVPLDQTGFRLDPEHPRTSSAITDLLAPTPITLLQPGDPLPAEGLSLANAASLDQVAAYAALPLNTLPAGGADFFKALLAAGSFPRPDPSPGNASETTPSFPLSPNAEAQRSPSPHVPTLILLGSASAYSRATTQQWLKHHLPVFSLPEHFSSNPSHAASFAWQSDILAALLTRKLAILAITSPIEPAKALHHRQAFATVLHVLLTSQELSRTPLQLYIEGGATAAAALDTLNWTELVVLNSLAPGVVSLRPAAAPHISLTIKPGSYPWPAGLIQSR